LIQPDLPIVHDEIDPADEEKRCPETRWQVFAKIEGKVGTRW